MFIRCYRRCVVSLSKLGFVVRLDRIDLNLFVVLDAIYRERSVTKVAQYLSLTQPAVSNALSRLRQTFDDPLFVRTPEGMMPTPVADSVIADVRKALGLLNRSVGINARFDPLKSDKKFRLAMNDLAQSLVLPRLQLRVRELAPSVTLSTFYSDRQKAVEELKNGSLDLLLDSPEVNTRDLGQQVVTQLPYVVAMRKEHPLAGKGVDLQDYLDCEHLHVSSRRKGRGQVDVGLHALGHTRRIAMRVQNYSVAEAITCQNDLLWTVPEVLAERTALNIVPVPFEVEPLRWNLFWGLGATDDPANSWLRNLMLEVMSELSASSE